MKTRIGQTIIRNFGELRTVTRPTGPGVYTNGVYVPTGTTTLQVMMSVQPLTMREREALRDAGDRTRETRKAYSVGRLYGIRDGVLTPADIVTLEDGRKFEVRDVEPWEGSFWKAILVAQNAVNEVET